LIVSSAEIFDPSTGAWTATSDMAEPRYGAVAALLPTGQVLVAGGIGPQPGGSPNNLADWIELTSSEIYNPPTGTWIPGPSMISRTISRVSQRFPRRVRPPRLRMTAPKLAPSQAYERISEKSGRPNLD
jgi:hypothetical protein